MRSLRLRCRVPFLPLLPSFFLLNAMRVHGSREAREPVSPLLGPIIHHLHTKCHVVDRRRHTECPALPVSPLLLHPPLLLFFSFLQNIHTCIHTTLVQRIRREKRGESRESLGAKTKIYMHTMPCLLSRETEE